MTVSDCLAGLPCGLKNLGAGGQPPHPPPPSGLRSSTSQTRRPGPRTDGVAKPLSLSRSPPGNLPFRQWGSTYRANQASASLAVNPGRFSKRTGNRDSTCPGSDRVSSPWGVVVTAHQKADPFSPVVTPRLPARTDHRGLRGDPCPASPVTQKLPGLDRQANRQEPADRATTHQGNTPAPRTRQVHDHGVASVKSKDKTILR